VLEFFKTAVDCFNKLCFDVVCPVTWWVEDEIFEEGDKVGRFVCAFCDGGEEGRICTRKNSFG